SLLPRAWPRWAWHSQEARRPRSPGGRLRMPRPSAATMAQRHPVPQGPARPGQRRPLRSLAARHRRRRIHHPTRAGRRRRRPRRCPLRRPCRLTRLAGPRRGTQSRPTRTRARMPSERARVLPGRPSREARPGQGRRPARPRPASHRKSRTPRRHWLLVSLVMLVFAVGLLIEGYTHGVLGENSADTQLQAGAPAAPASVVRGGPVIRATSSGMRSYRIPPKTVALTFDDGPDPTWTPKVLAVLRKYRVPATFFVVGAHAASYPGLIRQELSEGDEVGSHTYTHTYLATATWREGLELTLTQNALAGAAGVHTRLLRMPYSSEPDALTSLEWRAAREAGHDGYLVVLTDLDTDDWARPGVARIVTAATPHDGRGAIIMFHDGGGNREPTAAALGRVITRLRARGYRFATVTGALGMPAGDAPATAGQRLIGRALVATQEVADRSVAILAALLLVASVLTIARL